MNSLLHSEIRQIAEQHCTTTEPYARTAWIAGFHAFAELVARLHKQNATTQSAWIEANTRRRPAFMNTFDEQSMLDQAIHDHREIAEAAAKAERQQQILAHEQLQMKLSIAEHRADHYQNQAELLQSKTASSIWQDRFGQWHGRG